MVKQELPPETELLVHIHLAEYTQITTRNTYYMSVSFAFWSVAGGPLTKLGCPIHDSLIVMSGVRSRFLEPPKILSRPLHRGKPVHNPQTKPLTKMKWIAVELWGVWYTESSK
jgi:hypothetical protein